MQIITSTPGGVPYVRPRTSFHEITHPTNPLQPRRLKIVEPTVIRGVPVYPGSVFEFDVSGEGREDYFSLLHCLKANPVKLDTPLYVAKEPPTALPKPKEPGVTEQLAAELFRQIAAAANQPKGK